jgi:hypothetical protein
LKLRKVDIPVAPPEKCQLVIDWIKTTPNPTHVQYHEFIINNKDKIDKKTIDSCMQKLGVPIPVSDCKEVDKWIKGLKLVNDEISNDFYLEFIKEENLQKLKLDKPGVDKCIKDKHYKVLSIAPGVTPDKCKAVDSWLSKQVRPIKYEAYNGFINSQKNSKLKITQEEIDTCLKDRKVDIPVASADKCQLVADWLKTTPKPDHEQYHKFIESHQDKIDKKTIDSCMQKLGHPTPQDKCKEINKWVTGLKLVNDEIDKNIFDDESSVSSIPNTLINSSMI